MPSSSAAVQIIDEELDLEQQARGRAFKQLESTAASATLWTIVAYGASQVIRMVNNIVLTHLLLPEYFGLMALVSTIMMGLALISDVGLLPSIIGSPRGDEPIFLNTAWTVQIVRGCGLWLIALVLTHPLALFYRDARLNLIIPIVAFTAIIGGLNGTGLLTAARHIGVRRIYLVDFLSQVFAMAVTVAWACVSPSIWALIVGVLSGAAFKAVVSHMPLIHRGHRNQLAWEKEALRSLVSFGKWILLGTAFYFFASQADRLILGRLVSFTTLGIYGVAFTISEIPRQVILQFASRVGFPFVAKLTHLPAAEFRKVISRYRFYCLLSGAFLLTTIIFTGPLFIRYVYDQRYREAMWMIPILSLGLWHTLLYNTTGTVLFALGKPKYNAIGTACFCVTMFIGLPLAYHLAGMFGAVVIVAAGDLPFYLVLGIGAQREKIAFWRQDALATTVFLAMLALGLFVRSLLT